jgi:SAM-dependent methyltransferase
MDNKTIELFLNLNNQFYELNNEEFNKTRQNHWNGWYKCIEFINLIDKKEIKVLDLGCGNGRFLDFLKKNIKRDISYTGLDNNAHLLSRGNKNEGRFIKKDIFSINEITNLNFKFDLIVGFGVTHHIPSNKLRVDWHKQVGQLLENNGILILTYWDFQESKAINFKDSKEYLELLEEGDFLLSWGKNNNGLRFCHKYNKSEIISVIENFKEIKIRLIGKFISDGKNNSKNLYLLFKNHRD